MKKLLSLTLSLFAAMTGFAQTTATWDGTENNCAKGRNVYISEYWSGQQANITDGNLATTCQLKISDTSNPKQWVVVDLGYNYDVTKISITTSGDRYDSAFKIYGAASQTTEPTFADGTDAISNWTEVLDVTNSGITSDGEHTNTYTISGNYRYIKYQTVTRGDNQTDEYGTTFNEIRIAGTTTDSEASVPVSLELNPGAWDANNQTGVAIWKLNSVGERIGGDAAVVNTGVTLTSNNENVVKVVSSTTIERGSAYGTAVITAKLDEKNTYGKEVTGSYTFEFKNEVITSLTVTPGTLTTEGDDPVGVNVSGYNESKELVRQLGKGEFTLTSSNDKVVMVSDATNQLLKAVGAGTATITATYKNTAGTVVTGTSSEITIKAAEVGGITLTVPTLKTGYERDATVTLYRKSDNKVIKTCTADDVTLTSSDPTVVSVSGLTLTALKASTSDVTITATYKNNTSLTATQTLQVTDASMTVSYSDKIATCNGDWDEKTFKEIDANIIHITGLNGLPSEISNNSKNPNALVVEASGAVSGPNVCKNVGVGFTVANLNLTDGYDFVPGGWFNVTDATFNITLSANHYSFVFFPFQIFSVPEGVHVYKISKADASGIMLEEITNVSKTSTIQRESTYVIKADSEGTYSFTGGEACGAVADANNKTTGYAGLTLVATMVKTTAPDGCWMINKNNQLAKVSGSNVTLYPFAGYIAANEVFSTSGAAKLNISEGGTATDISAVEVETNSNDGKTYNLAGQVVGSNYKGIVIRNGKKFINK